MVFLLVDLEGIAIFQYCNSVMKLLKHIFFFGSHFSKKEAIKKQIDGFKYMHIGILASCHIILEKVNPILHS